ncbi:LytTR family DNA-binding domain-containing protein [Extibacter muris]|uniref:LytTR family DNA-binding domain-containing protein n=1 Tax=Extibacter muris TaxID=1796622 RepID=UPI001D064306|nr:LytTR family DNA-binding domain-containing protein [Extibacter muris]MCB6200743.1 LytTR family transcriptional regulator [Extibacter muris]MCQ4665413.1 LytTR family transcriptional regulator [Extibacter muris]MCQ4694790.1 LytTR family transcriptional regulator [Extibacter muris]
MLLKLEQDTDQKDIEISIKYAVMSQEVTRLISLIRSAETHIRCIADGKEKLLNVSEIYYAESVDKRTFIYCESKVYRTDLRLYQLLETLSPAGFVQISKSCILNINVLDFIRPLLNSRMEATLINGERLNVSRKYIANIKSKLQEGM